MGVIRNVFLLGFSIFVLYVGIAINNFLKVPPKPQLPNTWWGKGPPKEDNKSIKPFSINISQEVLDDLQVRLKNHRPFVPPLEGIAQQYGMNTNLLKEVVEFWRTKYNWREREKFLNKFPQFKTQVQGLDIHFIHVKPTSTLPKNVRVIPLLLLHGWPGSVREFYDFIPLLTSVRKGKEFIFEVVVPSLPGYGFSEGASRPGCGPAQIANIFKNLMLRLGHDKFYVQGGDWGSMIASALATLFPEHIIGMHSNMCGLLSDSVANFKVLLGSFYPPLVVDKEYEDFMYPLSKVFSFLILESGYFHLQATKPDTVGVALNDSPVGLAAYILEKFTTWTNQIWKERLDGGLQEKFSYTDLLDNVMIYWVTGSITTSARLYSEGFNKATMDLQLDSIPVDVPAACARFRNEILQWPDSLLKRKYPLLLHSSLYDDGGHFAAFEVPNVLADDVWTAVQTIEDYYKTKEKT